MAPRKPGAGQGSAAPGKARSGFNFEGLQEIVSNPPHPNNNIQTVMQPAKKNLPELRAFVPLPNLVQTAAPAPPSLKAPLAAPAPAALSSTALPLPPPTVSTPKNPDIPLLPAAPVESPRLRLPDVVPAPMALNSAPSAPIPAPTPPQAPRLATPNATAEATGADSRDVLLMSAMPAPPTPEVKVPAAEARGQFVVAPSKGNASPDSAPGAPGTSEGQPSTQLGTSASSSGTGHDAAGGHLGVSGGGGGGSGTEGSGTAASGEGVGAGSGPGRGHGAGNSPGSGTGAGAGPGASPFPGITIQGGEGPATAVSVPPPSRTDSEKNGEHGSYGFTVVSTGNSGGGLGDFGVFFNEAVFTDYLNTSTSPLNPEPNWILQYAVLNAGNARMETFDPPYPITKVKPDWPLELMPKYRGQMLVAYMVIDAEGKIRALRMIQSPDSRFSDVVSKALEGWVFRPTRVNGQPVAVKALLGIPIVASRRLVEPH